MTPTFRAATDIYEWAAEPDTPALSEAEYDRVAQLATENFGATSDDGMSAENYRSSVDGADLRASGLLSSAPADG